MTITQLPATSQTVQPPTSARTILRNMARRPPTPPRSRASRRLNMPEEGRKLRSGRITTVTTSREKVVTGDTVATPITVETPPQNEGEGEKETASINFVHQYFEQGEKDHQSLRHNNLDLLLQHQLIPENEYLTYNIYSLELSNDYGTPETIWEAIRGPESELWTKSATAEINNFLKRKSWKFVPKEEILAQGRKLIDTKWVFKIKDEPDRTQRYKSRVVTKGFQQIPGVDYTEKFSPVAQASSLRAGLSMALYKDWICELVDIEAAFLEGRLKT